MKSLYTLRNDDWYSLLYTDDNNGKTDVGFVDQSGFYRKNGDQWTNPKFPDGMVPAHLPRILDINDNAEKLINVKRIGNTFTAEYPKEVQPILPTYLGIDVKKEKITSCTISFKLKSADSKVFTGIEQVYKTENLKTGEKMTTTVTTDLRLYSGNSEKTFISAYDVVK